MSKFYWPNGEDFENINEFIQYYNNSYYLQNDRVIKRVPQNSKYVEKEIEYILENGIRKKEDIEKIIAWKIGSIKHAESEKEHKFVYYNDKPNMNRYKREIPLEPLFTYILEDISALEKQAKEHPQKVLKNLLGFDGIGPVYAITILYFLSRKMYPIYDQYAHFALKAIADNTGFTDKLITNAALNQKVVLCNDSEVLFSTYQEHYLNLLKEIFGKDRYNDRDVDRALWVYGHLFKNTKTNQKRMR